MSRSDRSPEPIGGKNRVEHPESASFTRPKVALVDVAVIFLLGE